MEVMMEPNRLMLRLACLNALCVSVALGLGGVALAADPAAPMPDTPANAAPAQGQVEAPKITDSSDAAFKKLAAGKKFVTPDDVKVLPGFDIVFESADAKHEGRLNAAQFKTAWKAYIAAQKANRG
jgi:hypothetical protein